MPKRKKAEEEKREPGRPPDAGVNRDVRYLLRMTADERAEWEAAAAAKEMSLSAWMRDVLNRSAKRST